MKNNNSISQILAKSYIILVVITYQWTLQLLLVFVCWCGRTVAVGRIGGQQHWPIKPLSVVRICDYPTRCKWSLKRFPEDLLGATEKKKSQCSCSFSAQILGQLARVSEQVHSVFFSGLQKLGEVSCTANICLWRFPEDLPGATQKKKSQNRMRELSF